MARPGRAFGGRKVSGETGGALGDHALRSRHTGSVVSYRDAVRESLRHMLDTDENVIIMGQGVDDHKGTFGTTLGLAEEFGAERVFDTPLAEEALTGVAVGLALNGMYPVHVHIRADFGLLAMNQIINLAAKYRYMFGGKFEVPMLIRLTVGRSWGQGAQHSQSLQSLFAHIPGLTVVMPSSSGSVLDTYPYLSSSFPNPVISLEHRLLVDLDFKVDEASAPAGPSPLVSRVVREGADLTIVATSIMVLEALRAAEHLATHTGAQAEVIDLHCVSEIDPEPILRSVRKTGRLLVADTSWIGYGVCAEVCRIVGVSDPGMLNAPIVTLGMQPVPCPTAKSLEDLFYPNLGTMVDEMAALVTGRRDHGVALPDEQSMADVYKHFKGPF